MLHKNIVPIKTLFTGFILLTFSTLFSQDNSPYSRYGLGDVVPNTNIVNRGMGGVTAGYADFLSINFSNPASYSAFQTIVEKTGKPVSGRVLLDVGVNIENRTLRSPNQVAKFTTSNALFSYVHVGVPLRKNWGLSFGIKPLSRISYKIQQNRRTSIDSLLIENNGEGGSYLPTIGTGFRIKNFSAGVNLGYLFGKRETSSRIGFANDSVEYKNGSRTTTSSFGSVFLNTGIQYKIDISKQTLIRFGVAGNLKQTLKGSQDFKDETFVRTSDGTDVQLDSVSERLGVGGEVIYPASATFGFVIEHGKEPDKNSWSLGADFIYNKWEDYRFFGAADQVKNNWQLRTGGQYRPKPTRNYFSNVAYRAGFSIGPDHITAGGNLPTFSASAGFGLPVPSNRSSPAQFSIINLAVEYNKRGNDQNLLKENVFRISLGLNFSDLWFTKRKYD
ncbi:MAG TPA: hypothetical protein VEY06_15475 [Flavisolibacter sp.]|nr:hypothetical protein [Flavisolibacter sp.]